LVVLEAHAVGTPVLGSGFGGIAESVRDGIDGWLVPQSEMRTVEGWARALTRLAADPEAVRAARTRMRPARTMDHVADEMRQIYQQSVLAKRQQSAGLVQRVFRKVFRVGGLATAGILASDQLDLLQLLASI
jgi:glycosyltransferase involved in cell wall biosynthesis